ncbi:LysE family translocator [Microbacterium sp.]|uniref:LysE family translocator n=1 Tax=Microbacterium sp. TaxID=51671 RepID=UPI002810EB68|nr:LysE family translocator [Microbacterium sp.]
MEQFIAVAAAHFLALLIPGVDFFLIVRAAMSFGWRIASGACVGIAAANGLFIGAAFSGVSLISNPLVLGVIQAAGGVFLAYVGVMFLRARVDIDVGDAASTGRSTWLENFGLGLLSGLLNPKNALFYVSLATVVSESGPAELVAYGIWMFSIVLVWDLFIAVALGSRRAVTAATRIVPWVTKIAGGFLILMGAGMIVGLAVAVAG